MRFGIYLLTQFQNQIVYEGRAHLEGRAARQGAAESREGSGIGEGEDSGLGGSGVIGRERVDADIREDGRRRDGSRGPGPAAEVMLEPNVRDDGHAGASGHHENPGGHRGFVVLGLHALHELCLPRYVHVVSARGDAGRHDGLAVLVARPHAVEQHACGAAERAERMRVGRVRFDHAHALHYRIVRGRGRGGPSKGSLELRHASTGHRQLVFLLLVLVVHALQELPEHVLPREA